MQSQMFLSFASNHYIRIFKFLKDHVTLMTEVKMLQNFITG